MATTSGPRVGLGGVVLGGVGAIVLAGGILILVVVSMIGAITQQQAQGGEGAYEPSEFALEDIPKEYLRAYLAAGERFEIDWAILAGIGAVETNHGQLDAPGVTSGANAFGCCGGPMQFYFVPGPGRLAADETNSSTWGQMAVDGNGDGAKVVWDYEDAIPAAARYLKASGAPDDYQRAIFAYNRADWYVADVQRRAERYRGAAQAAGGAQNALDPSAAGSAEASRLLREPRLKFTDVQRTDLRRGGFDPRLVATLLAVAKEHTIIVTALRADHSPGTNHEAGRAFDVGSVDGEICRGKREGPCADLVRELADIEGELRSTELIYCFDPDGPNNPNGFARPDHCDHSHIGWDG